MFAGLELVVCALNGIALLNATLLYMMIRAGFDTSTIAHKKFETNSAFHVK